MAIQCPTCSKVNPANAAYCYYDGRILSKLGSVGPLSLGTSPFPIPFCFSDGESCANFNQLALSCDQRWSEARSLLVGGVWDSFFREIGRVDLVMAARQAAKEVDPDVGLACLLERLPADSEALRPPKLGVLSALEDLGTLEPGKDHKFEIVIANQGMLVLRGKMMTDCEWMYFGERQGSSSMKWFQTRDTYTLSVRIPAEQLRARPKPLEGHIVIETNGGRQTVTVRANVPIQPFPWRADYNNILEGAKSPRELAKKAKDHPQEAAVLFEQGAVKAWYTSNGWIYPIQGTQGKGKAAVQQFFEALGLTKPPQLEISTEHIVCQGEVGQQLTETVTISTKEPKFVNAEAQSNDDWIQVQPGKSQGNSVTIPLRIAIPQRPGETLHTNILFQGNGQQQFLVPVTLTVASKEDEKEEKETGGGQRGLLVAALALVLVIAVGAMTLVLSRRGSGPPHPPILVDKPEPPPPAVVSNEAWWDSIPNNKLAATVAELKEAEPANQTIFDRLSIKSDVERYKVYEQLAAKLPELVRNPKVKEPLGRLVTACCVYEPSELNLSPLRRALANQFPEEGSEFRPEETEAELERAHFWLRVVFDAITHNAVRPDRGRSLANDLGKVFDFSLDSSAPADELKGQAEKLLAVRCYRNILPTATHSIDHALTIRTALLARFPQQLSADFCEQVDVDLLAIGLSRDKDNWPKLEAIFKACLESQNLSLALKIIDIYEKVNVDLAKQMELLLAAKWKIMTNPRLTQAAKAEKVRRSLVGDVNKGKISPADRLAQWEKLSSTTLSAVKAGQTQESALLHDTIRLAHASTMGSILVDKDAEVERFDELIAKLPEVERPKVANPDEGKPRPPAGKEVITLGMEPWSVKEKLTAESERDPRRGTFRKAYSVALKAGQLVTIDLVSGDFNAYLRLDSTAGVQQAADDDGGGFPNARISYAPKTDGIYRVIATTSGKGELGSYTLTIRAGGGFPGFGFGVPFGPPVRRIGPRLFPVLGPLGPIGPVGPNPFMVPPEAPKPKENKDPQLHASDLNDLGNKQSTVRIAAFANLAGNVSNDLPPQHAQKIARYLLLTVVPNNELDEVIGKLESLAKCRPVLVALADLASHETATQQRTERVIGRVLGQVVRFARDEDWRSACRKLLLLRVLDLTPVPTNNGDKTANILRDLYKEQGLALGLEEPEFLEQTQPSRVLESLIKHVASKAIKHNPALEEKDYLEQITRHIQAAQFVADNELEYMVLLQRIWLKVLTAYLKELAPAQAKGLKEILPELLAHDRESRGVLDQLRAGEERILRAWMLALNLKQK